LNIVRESFKLMVQQESVIVAGTFGRRTENILKR